MNEPLPRMVPVEKLKKKCPVCGRNHYCMISPDGQRAICTQVESRKPLANGTMWLHRLEEPLPAFTAPDHKRKGRPKGWQLEAEEYAGIMDVGMKFDLALKLGLPITGLDCISLLGWNIDEECFTFPEQDGQGKVIGLNRRFKDGTKKQMMGSARGITVPYDWDQGTGPLYIVEGPTDTAAMICAGLCAWGRPSNTGGVAFLAEAIQKLPEAIPVVIVGENDKKPDGLWPGLTGAISVAGSLSEKVMQTVKWTMAPTDFKDVREYLTGEMFAGADWKMRGEYLQAEFITHDATYCPDGYSSKVAELKKQIGFDEERWKY